MVLDNWLLGRKWNYTLTHNRKITFGNDPNNIKNSYTSVIKRQSIEKWAKDVNRHFSYEDTETDKLLKRWATGKSRAEPQRNATVLTPKRRKRPPRTPSADEGVNETRSTGRRESVHLKCFLKTGRASRHTLRRGWTPRARCWNKPVAKRWTLQVPPVWRV